MTNLRLALALGSAASVLLAAAPAPTVTTDVPAATAAVAVDGVVRGDLGPVVSTDPREAAAIALADQASVLGVDAADFALTDVRTSIVGTHVRGTQLRDGVPVLGTSTAVHMVDGRVWTVEARGTDLPGTAVTAPIGEDAALRIVRLAAGLGGRVADHEDATRWMIERDGVLVDTYRVSVAAVELGVVGTFDVDAATGAIVGEVETRHFDDGTALIFDPNPIVTARDNRLRQDGLDLAGVDTDLSNAAIDAALVEVAVLEYDVARAAAGNLVGPWVDARGTAPLVGPDFAVPKTHPGFETLMAYAHVDRAQRWFQSLGFTGAAGVNAESQVVYTPRAEGYDNSFYHPALDIMLLGAGGVDDGEDAEVIIHELGHAVHDAQVKGWGQHLEGRGMGEGFGDFLAAAMYAPISGGFQDTCVADWDAVSYSSDAEPCLRRTDGNKHYPEDLHASSEHANGELWSAYLWRVWERIATTEEAGGDPERLAQLRSDRSVQLVLASHEFLSTTATFADAVAGLRQARAALGMGDHVEQILVEEAQQRGFPLNPI